MATNIDGVVAPPADGVRDPVAAGFYVSPAGYECVRGVSPPAVTDAFVLDDPDDAHDPEHEDVLRWLQCRLNRDGAGLPVTRRFDRDTRVAVEHATKRLELRGRDQGCVTKALLERLGP